MADLQEEQQAETAESKLIEKRAAEIEAEQARARMGQDEYAAFIADKTAAEEMEAAALVAAEAAAEGAGLIGRAVRVLIVWRV